MSTFDLLADLPLEVDGYELEGLKAEVSSGFERLSTVVHLHGAGAEGVGEDVVYDAEDHVATAGGRAGAEAGRPLHAGRVLRADRRARPVPGRAAARRGLAPVPALDVSQRRARPGAAAGRAPAARGARARGAGR